MCSSGEELMNFLELVRLCQDLEKHYGSVILLVARTLVCKYVEYDAHLTFNTNRLVARAELRIEVASFNSFL
jgi:hypothetical protein